MEDESNDFREFLARELQLDEENMNLLIDGGFDDIDSLKFAKIDTLRIIGIHDPEAVYSRIKDTLALSVNQSHDFTILQQDGGDIQDL
jgi:hypothetical protein